MAEIVKRCGRVEPFSRAKIIRGIRLAAGESGDDAVMPEEIAEAIHLHLGGGRTGVDDLFENLLALLSRTGHEDCAAALARHREDRDVRREFLVILGGEGTFGPWDKERLARGIARHRGLDERTAREIARTVEGRILGAGVQRAASFLVRALVDNELMHLGEGRRADERREIGLGRAEIEHVLFSGGDTDRGIAGAVLERYLLDAVLPPEAAAAVREGRFVIVGLGSPGVLSRLRVPRASLGGADPLFRTGVFSAIERMEEAVRLLAWSREVVVEGWDLPVPEAPPGIVLEAADPAQALREALALDRPPVIAVPADEALAPLAAKAAAAGVRVRAGSFSPARFLLPAAVVNLGLPPAPSVAAAIEALGAIDRFWRRLYRDRGAAPPGFSETDSLGRLLVLAASRPVPAADLDEALAGLPPETVVSAEPLPGAADAFRRLADPGAADDAAGTISLDPARARARGIEGIPLPPHPDEVRAAFAAGAACTISKEYA